MAATKLKIKRRFKEKARKLSSEEFDNLEAEILEDGRVRDALVVMQGDVIVDGHNRYSIATKHKLPFDVVVKTFESDDAADQWIIRNQLARRNLSANDYKMYLGWLYNSKKGESSGRPKEWGQNDPIIAKPPAGRMAERIASETGSSPATVKRAGKRAEAYDKLPRGIKTLIDEKPSRASDKAVIKMASMPSGEWSSLAREVRTGQKQTFDEALGLKNGKPQKPAKGKEKPSAASVADEIKRKHFSGAGGLPQQLDGLAKANSGKGEQYEIANNALDEFLKALKKMRSGCK